MDKLVYVGNITNYFGLKGEVKLSFESNHENEILKVGNNLYIDKQKYVIKKIRFHQDKYLVLFDGFEDINLINDLIRKEVYVNKEEIDLGENDYLTAELFGLDIIDNNECIGKVEKILISKKDILIQNKEYIIPLNEKYYVGIDIKNNKIYVNGSRELKYEN